MHNQPRMDQDDRDSTREQRESDRDLAALQGAWEQVDLEADGVSNPPDAHSVPGALTTFAGDRFEVRAPDGTLLLAGTFILDASTTPKSITWIDSMGEDTGMPLPAIYRLDGDDFVFVAGSEGAARPRVFKTTQGQTMRAFVRRR
jgi:uncharacterized protein (TIGR03067 family)